MNSQIELNCLVCRLNSPQITALTLLSFLCFLGSLQCFREIEFS